jgi:2-polyprenyl-3-methyl-5-hydroxy-6-metoxy-1,4-benzoquinol methylase
MTVATRERADAEISVGVMERPFCLLCGAAGEELYSGLRDWLFDCPGNWGMKKCAACGIVWLDPQPIEDDIPKLYRRYYTHGGNPATFFQELRKATLQHVLARMGYRVDPPKSGAAQWLSRVPSIARASALEVMGLNGSKTGSLLDVGCGSGEFLARMRALGWSVTGVDPDPAAVQRGREAGLEIFQGTIADVPASQAFDAITLNHVIEHVSDPIALLKECSKRLAPARGALLITTPNLNSLGHKWFKRYWRGLEVPRHLAVFSPQGLTYCVSHSGLRVRELSTETRMARVIFRPSLSARRWQGSVGNSNGFDLATNIAACGFQFLEECCAFFKDDLGEEIYCVCETHRAGNADQ